MDLYLELSALLGAEFVSKERRRLEEHSRDKWFASHLPDVVVEPKSTGQISELLHFANERRIAVTARGAGSDGHPGAEPPRPPGVSSLPPATGAPRRGDP